MAVYRDTHKRYPQIDSLHPFINQSGHVNDSEPDVNQFRRDGGPARLRVYTAGRGQILRRSESVQNSFTIIKFYI